MKWLKVPDPEFAFLDFEEADRLVKGGVAEWATMIVLGLGTGMRYAHLSPDIRRDAVCWKPIRLTTG